ncbi:MAG: hypothetical protein R8P61_10000 [Bacteroidia bacterium]|nr:hypothetical protein [Bacteroidia bacterium]
MKFSDSSLFDLFDERDLINIQLENYRFKTLISPPLLSIRPFSIISQENGSSEYELSDFKLKDVFDSPSDLDTKINSTLLGNLPESPAAERSEAVPFLQKYLKEMGADSPSSMTKAFRIYEEIKFRFNNVRREAPAISENDLFAWVLQQNPNNSHKIVKKLQAGELVYMAFEVGKFSSIRLDLKDTGEDEIEDGSGDVRVSIRNNKRIQFSSRKRPTIGFNLRQLNLEDGKIKLTDPDKEGSGAPVMGGTT